MLAPQWVDELALHAPGLKVLVYEGWSKLQVPISEADAQEAREARTKLKDKKKARKARSKAAASKSKSNTPIAGNAKGKGKAKAPEGEDVEMKDADQAEAAEDEQDEDEDEIVDWCTYVNRFDVVITTYNVLQQDLSVARPPPLRPRRAGVTYGHNDRSRSPLILCEWYRVIMDEVQMVGGGKTEYVLLVPARLACLLTTLAGKWCL